MKVTRGYKTELDPTDAQRTLFNQCAGVSRFAYNYGLARKQEAYTKGEKTPYAVQLQKELTARKHDDLFWLSDVSKWIVQNALRHLDKGFDRFFERCKLKGSNNRKKAQKKLARMHQKIANIRKDALHKATSAIVAKTKPDGERPSAIVLEDLHIQGMLKNRKLSRAIADVGMYEFKRQLTYKAAFAGVQVKEVSRWYPSSKTCSSCGTVRDELGLDERVFVCHDCGYVAERDYNAAKNLAALA